MEVICRAEDLKKLYPLKRKSFFDKKRRYTHAVDGVNFGIYKGETFGIVGESGCGKTTLARMLLRLIEPTSGKVFFGEREITSLNRQEMKQVRRRMQMIFQDPYSSLDPKKTILNIIAEPLKVHHLKGNGSLEEKVEEALRLVDLPATADFMSKVPDELSGGQRQRVGIARALVLGAEFIVADEPVSMLDASVKAGITSLLMGLKQKIQLTYVFITHEIALAYHICDRIAVMYLGKIVEMGRAEEVIHEPEHPYTRLLMEAIPPLLPDDKWGRNITGKGEIPLYAEPEEGCSFYPRCPIASEPCRKSSMDLQELKEGHFVSCLACRV